MQTPFQSSDAVNYPSQPQAQDVFETPPALHGFPVAYPPEADPFPPKSGDFSFPEPIWMRKPAAKPTRRGPPDFEKLASAFEKLRVRQVGPSKIRRKKDSRISRKPLRSEPPPRKPDRSAAAMFRTVPPRNRHPAFIPSTKQSAPVAFRSRLRRRRPRTRASHAQLHALDIFPDKPLLTLVSAPCEGPPQPLFPPPEPAPSPPAPVLPASEPVPSPPESLHTAPEHIIPEPEVSLDSIIAFLTNCDPANLTYNEELNDPIQTDLLGHPSDALWPLSAPPLFSNVSVPSLTQSSSSSSSINDSPLLTPPNGPQCLPDFSSMFDFDLPGKEAVILSSQEYLPAPTFPCQDFESSFPPDIAAELFGDPSSLIVDTSSLDAFPFDLQMGSLGVENLPMEKPLVDKLPTEKLPTETFDWQSCDFESLDARLLADYINF